MKELLKTTCTKKLGKVNKFFNITKAYKSKEKFFQPIGYPYAPKTISKS